VGEGGGFVDAETGLWIGPVRIRVILDPLEEPVHDAQIESKKTNRAWTYDQDKGGSGAPCGRSAFGSNEVLVCRVVGQEGQVHVPM